MDDLAWKHGEAPTILTFGAAAAAAWCPCNALTKRAVMLRLTQGPVEGAPHRAAASASHPASPSMTRGWRASSHRARELLLARDVPFHVSLPPSISLSIHPREPVAHVAFLHSTRLSSATGTLMIARIGGHTRSHPSLIRVGVEFPSLGWRCPAVPRHRPRLRRYQRWLTSWGLMERHNQCDSSCKPPAPLPPSPLLT